MKRFIRIDLLLLIYENAWCQGASEERIGKIADLNALGASHNTIISLIWVLTDKVSKDTIVNAYYDRLEE